MKWWRRLAKVIVGVFRRAAQRPVVDNAQPTVRTPTPSSVRGRAEGPAGSGGSLLSNELSGVSGGIRTEGTDAQGLHAYVADASEGFGDEGGDTGYLDAGSTDAAGQSQATSLDDRRDLLRALQNLSTQTAAFAFLSRAALLKKSPIGEGRFDG